MTKAILKSHITCVKRFFNPLCILILLTVISMSGHAERVNVDNLWYEVDQETKTASVTSSNLTGRITIPREINVDGETIRVTTIGELAFHGPAITIVSMPWIKRIEDKAFYYCSDLTTIELGEDLSYVGNSAFEKCGHLTKLTFPDALETIGSKAFKDCSSITEVTVGTGLKTIGDYAFNGCVAFTAIILPPSFSELGLGSFMGCSKLTVAELGNTITRVPDHAFEGCKALAEIKLPSTVESIGNRAFYNCSGLATVRLNEGIITIGFGVFFNNSGLSQIVIPGSVISMGRNCFVGCTNLMSVTFADGEEDLTLINDQDTFAKDDAEHYGPRENYFYDSPIRSLTLGRNLKYQYWAPANIASSDGVSGPFANKTTLTNVRLGNNVNYIGNYLFYGCTNIKKISFPSSLKSVGEGCFAKCTSLESVDMKSSVLEGVGQKAFYKCTSLSSLNFPETMTYIGIEAFQMNTGLLSVEFDDNKDNMSSLLIESYAFADCPSLETILFPVHLKKLGEYACWNDIHLKSIELREDPEREITLSLGEYCFAECAELSKLDIPAKTVSIANYCFYNCTSIASVSFKDSPDPITLGYGAKAESSQGVKDDAEMPLFGNSRLKSLYMGRNIDYLPYDRDKNKSTGYSPFYNQDALTDIKFSQTGNVTYVLENLLRNVKKCESLQLPESLETIGRHAFSYMESLQEIKIPNKVTSMDNYTFYEDTALKTAILSNSCPVLPQSIFQNCKSLERITIPSIVTKINDSAFDRCMSLEEVTFEGSEEPLSMGVGFKYTSGCGLFTQTGLVTLNLDRHLLYSEAPFSSIPTLKNINLGENVKVIGAGMFSSSKALEDLYLPDHITSIGVYAFGGCYNLKNIRFSNNLSQISERAFTGCSSLTELTFPSSLTSIADNSFSRCTSLRKLDLGNSLKIIGPSAFENDTALEMIILPKSLYGLGVRAFANCTTLPYVEVRYISSVGKEAFMGCTGLRWVSLSENTSSLGENSFADCPNITYVKSYATIPPEGLINFVESVPSNGTLYVPENCEEDYEWSVTWENWKNIRPLSDFVYASSISLKMDTATIENGKTITLSVTVGDENATDKRVIWSSSDDNIAKVDEFGTVTGVGVGTCTITVTTADGSDLSASCTVTVEEEVVVPPVVPVTSVALDVTEKTLTTGESFTLTATVLPEDATDKSVIWTSSDASVATVDADGLVKAVTAGTCTITAATADGSDLSASCTVTVEEEVVVPPVILVNSIALDITEKTLTAGESFTLTATVLPEDATDKSVIWTSSDASVATVDADGLVKAVAAGTCAITATTADGSDLSASCAVTVEEDVVVPPAKENIVQVNSIYYRVDPATHAAEAIGCYDDESLDSYSQLKNAVIVATVEYEGETYDVTSISESAFNDAVNLESFTIEESTIPITVSEQTFKDYLNYNLPIKQFRVYRQLNPTSDYLLFRSTYLEELTLSGEATTVHDNAFYGATALKSVTLGEKITSVNYRAFLECNAITKVTSMAVVPPATGRECFDRSIFPSATLYVYNRSLDAYKAADTWKDFYDIKPLDPASGIDTIKYDKPVTVYTTTGLLINQAATPDDIAKLSCGLYIIDGKKVMIK